jgi:hypothetical protein
VEYLLRRVRGLWEREVKPREDRRRELLSGEERNFRMPGEGDIYAAEVGVGEQRPC